MTENRKWSKIEVWFRSFPLEGYLAVIIVATLCIGSILTLREEKVAKEARWYERGYERGVAETMIEAVSRGHAIITISTNNHEVFTEIKWNDEK